MTDEAKQNGNRRRIPRTAFKPGQSGNPKGRPKLGESLAEVCRRKLPAEQLVAEMIKLSKSRNESVRMRALEWLADRGHGRVPQGVDLAVGGIGPEAQAMLGAIALSPQERRERIKRLRAHAASATTKAPDAEAAEADE